MASKRIGVFQQKYPQRRFIYRQSQRSFTLHERAFPINEQAAEPIHNFKEIDHDNLQLGTGWDEATTLSEAEVPKASSRRSSRYGDDEFELEKSVIIERPERWRLKNPTRKPQGQGQETTPLESRLLSNPYVCALTTPVRMCKVWRISLPSALLQRFSLFEIPRSTSGVLNEVEQSLQLQVDLSDFGRRSKHLSMEEVSGVILPLDRSKNRTNGTTVYSLFKKSHIEYTELRSRWKSLKEVFKLSFPELKVGWQSDMHILVERRLREILLRQFRHIGKHKYGPKHIGYFVDPNEANREGIVIAELCWQRNASPTGALEDSRYFMNVKHKLPAVRYYMDQLCGYETSARIREILYEKLSGTYDVDNPPTSIFVIESPLTAWPMSDLWRLRLYVGNRMDLAMREARH